MSDIGATPIAPPVRGVWNLNGHPSVVKWNGRLFNRTRVWAWPYPGVVAQYREALDRNAMHMLVYSDGHFDIDHREEANPDRGLVIEHAVRDTGDTPVGAAVRVAVGISIIALAAAAIGAFVGSPARRA